MDAGYWVLGGIALAALAAAGWLYVKHHYRVNARAKDAISAIRKD